MGEAKRKIEVTSVLSEEDSRMVELISKYQMQAASVVMTAFTDGYELGRQHAANVYEKGQADE